MHQNDDRSRHDPARRLLAAAMALADILAAENEALAGMNIPAAIALVASKQTATDRLLAAREHGSLPPTAEAIAAAERLRILAEDNRRLLERAMVAQKRVLACIAAAVPAAMARQQGYGATGTTAAKRMPPPVALSARA